MRAVITYVAVTAAVVLSGTAQAQVSKTLNGEARVVTATVEAIERASAAAHAEEHRRHLRDPGRAGQREAL